MREEGRKMEQKKEVSKEKQEGKWLDNKIGDRNMGERKNRRETERETLVMSKMKASKEESS